MEQMVTAIVNNTECGEFIIRQLDTRVDVSVLEKEREQLRSQLRQLSGAKNKLINMLDKLDVTDKHYDKKYQDMQNRLYSFYDEIEIVEEKIEDLQSRIINIQEEKITGENVFLFLQYSGIMYKNFTDAEKKKFFNTFIDSVEIFPEEQPDGRVLKSISFKFPVFYDGEDNITKICWDGETTVESVVCLSRENIND